MQIIPAIDIKGGRCVRLRQGKMDEATVYSENPIKVAQRWEAEGGDNLKVIHIVDLDAAIEGRPINHDIIIGMASFINTPIQVGGGIRTIEDAEIYLKLHGVKRIIIGTAALEDDTFLKEVIRKYPGRVAVGIDVLDDMVAVKGWVDVSKVTALDLAYKVEAMGAEAIIYTDISKDGMLQGPNLEANTTLSRLIEIPVIASGGVSNINDIRELKKTGASGVIVGKALYSGDLDLKEALKVGASTIRDI
ncbi:MAG: 1-(5-phosphoribosyl)-5-[(5-phosphoribosylamino)methylideneamino]imidazole-4-carboxamide isomerase [Deltaproteobacteria bacterium]|nr:1-(5-phosphoribosyl)-5-[(5-phosphoribosylamino)methylideneamino]imidazole-4-carboxamide isomerase [Deltaproteobacteria bacterium]